MVAEAACGRSFLQAQWSQHFLCSIFLSQKFPLYSLSWLPGCYFWLIISLIKEELSMIKERIKCAWDVLDFTPWDDKLHMSSASLDEHSAASTQNT